MGKRDFFVLFMFLGYEGRRTLPACQTRRSKQEQSQTCLSYALRGGGRRSQRRKILLGGSTGGKNAEVASQQREVKVKKCFFILKISFFTVTLQSFYAL